MTQSSSFFVKLSSFSKRLLPSPILRIPTEQERESQRRAAATGIVQRQAEGSVLLAAGKFNTAGLDFSEDGEAEGT